jgi:23S rRNA (adenine2503-C2)-methyltransferase
VSRRLKLDIPGPDRRVTREDVVAQGWGALFCPDGTGDAAPAAARRPLIPSRLVLEIGFGRGEFLIELATAAPEVAFVGVELSRKRVLKQARRLAKLPLANVRILHGRGEEALELFPPGSLEAVWINFPDPWPKARHQRRRLVQPQLVRAIAERLAPGGVLHLATDDVPYAEHVAAVLAAEPRLENAFAPHAFLREVPDRPPTAYEREWRAEGRPLHFFAARRRAGPEGSGSIGFAKDGGVGEASRVREPGRSLKDHSIESLRARFAALGIEPWRAEQVGAWLYARGVEDPTAWTDLPVALRERLAREWSVRALAVDGSERSADGTLKARLRAHDGALVESVLIPDGERTTLCISTQVGCPLACSFCATGVLGFTRNLSVAEIVDQVCRMRELLPPGQRVTNVVYMGMGEPLLNLPAVVESARILLHPKGFALGPRKVTISTAGVVPKIPTLLAALPVNLAVSLHAATDAVRDVLVPLNRRFPLATLLGTLRAQPALSARRPVFFEYTLIEGLNDAAGDARDLARLLHGLPAKVNLIPMNAHPDSPHRPPDDARVASFAGALSRRGVTVTVRRPRGADIDAACGQLAARRAVPRLANVAVPA